MRYFDRNTEIFPLVVNTLAAAQASFSASSNGVGKTLQYKNGPQRLCRRSLPLSLLHRVAKSRSAYLRREVPPAVLARNIKNKHIHGMAVLARAF